MIPLMDSGKVKKKLWKGLTILVAIKNIHVSWEEVKTSASSVVWKKLIPALTDACLYEVQDFSGGGNCVCDGISKRIRIRSGAGGCN